MTVAVEIPKVEHLVRLRQSVTDLSVMMWLARGAGDHDKAANCAEALDAAWEAYDALVQVDARLLMRG